MSDYTKMATANARGRAQKAEAERDAYTELLRAIRDALDVPFGATPDGHISRRDILVGRVGAVMAALDGPLDGSLQVGDAAAWLGRYVAEHEPIPDDYVLHADEAGPQP